MFWKKKKINTTPGEEFELQRERMVIEQLQRRGIKDERVLQAFRELPRHEFVLDEDRARSYDDHPLSIGYGQTISQPYIVSLMTESLELKGDEKVLEIGTGSGYQLAILARLAKAVYSVEIVEPLLERAKEVLTRLGFDNVKLKAGDGWLGWEEHSPFDAIIFTAAAPKPPIHLAGQLKEGGRMVAPVGRQRFHQDLMLYRKVDDRLIEKYLTGVVFVPITGKNID